MKPIYSPSAKRIFKRLGVRPHKARVVKIFPDQHLVELGDGSHLGYDRLLIATGANCCTQQCSGGATLGGVVKLDNLDDAHKILSLAGRRRVAVVVGGGITALEIVEGLVANGVRVHYFLRRDRYWNNVLDETESRIIEAASVGTWCKDPLQYGIGRNIGKERSRGASRTL